MKIVNRTTFLAMPAGTVFAKYEPCVFGDLAIKERSLASDFIYQSIADSIDCSGSGDFGDKLEDALDDGISLAMDFDCCGRDGCLNEGQLFAVWEPVDVAQLIARLQKAMLDAAEGREEAAHEP